MLHDGGWPMELMKPVDSAAAEGGGLGIVDGSGYSPPSRFPMREGDVRMWAAEVAFAMGEFLYRRGARVPRDNPDT